MRVGLPTVRFPLERGKLAELSRCFEDADPVWFDPNAAREAGFEDVPLLPTAMVIADHWREGGALSLAKAVGLDFARLLHGEVSWEYLRPLRVGEEVTVETRSLGTTTRKGKRGGEMTFLTIESLFINQDGETAVRRIDTMIETQSEQ